MHLNKRTLLSALSTLPLSLAARPANSRSRDTGKNTKILLVYYSRTENTAMLASLIQKNLALNTVRLEAIPIIQPIMMKRLNKYEQKTHVDIALPSKIIFQISPPMM